MQIDSHASSTQTEYYSEAKNNHGIIYYITKEQKEKENFIWSFSPLSILSIFIIGVLMQFIFNIDVFNFNRFIHKK